MALFDDDTGPRATPHQIGSDLALLSAEELSERIDALKQEITRLEAERSRKNDSRAAAESFFR